MPRAAWRWTSTAARATGSCAASMKGGAQTIAIAARTTIDERSRLKSAAAFMGPIVLTKIPNRTLKHLLSLRRAAGYIPPGRIFKSA